MNESMSEIHLDNHEFWRKLNAYVLTLCCKYIFETWVIIISNICKKKRKMNMSTKTQRSMKIEQKPATVCVVKKKTMIYCSSFGHKASDANKTNRKYLIINMWAECLLRDLVSIEFRITNVKCQINEFLNSEISTM